MRVLVTGATGFIGRHLVAELAARHKVVALARGTPPDDVTAPVRWVEQDLAGPLHTASLPRVDAVIHLAQSRRYRDFPDGAPDVYAVNVHSTFQLLEWARGTGARAFVLASTGGVYGYARHPLGEEDPVQLTNLYFCSKYAAEVLVGAYAGVLRPVVLRPFFVYGEGQRDMLIPRLAEKIVAGETIVVEGDPGIRINPVHVTDAVRVFEPALTGTLSGVVNVAGPDTVSVAALVAALGDAIGIRPAVRHRPSDVEGDLVGATERMREALGVTPRTALQDGLRRVAHDLRATAPEGP